MTDTSVSITDFKATLIISGLAIGTFVVALVVPSGSFQQGIFSAVSLVLFVNTIVAYSLEGQIAEQKTGDIPENTTDEPE